MPARFRALLIVAAAMALSGCNRRIELEPVYIGQVAPYSGRDEAPGERAKQGALLAAEEINKAENQLPGKHFSVIFADSLGDLANLQPVAVRLITVNRAAALLGGRNSAEAEHLGRAGLPYEVAVVTGASLSKQAPGDNVFSIDVGQTVRGEKLAQFLAHELKSTRVLLLTDSRDESCAALSAAVLKEFANEPNVHPDEWTYKTEAELIDIASRVAKAEPEALILSGSGTDLLKLRAALQKVGAKAAIIFAGDQSGISLVNAGKPGQSDLYVVTIYATGGYTSRGQDFVKRLQERFQQPPGFESAAANDSTLLVAEAMRRARSVRPAAVRATLSEPAFTFESLTGALSFTKDHFARRPLFVVRMHEGQEMLAKRYEPVLP